MLETAHRGPAMATAEAREAGPWAWRPSPAGFYEELARLATRWTPDPRLHVDADIAREQVQAAAAEHAPWLVHPCLAAITCQTPGDALQRDVNLLIWTAAHADLGAATLTVADPVTVWGPAGDLALDPGHHALADLGSALREQPAPPCALALDPWCRTVGAPIPGSWAEASAAPVDAQELVGDLRQLMRTVAVTEHTLPACMDWLLAVTRVVIPLRGHPDGAFRSGCEPDVPGMVYLDVTASDLQIAEALVHESAHRHLFVAEAEGPLVEPGHNGRYTSPLRPDPRPLRGILLAGHALAYIAALYADAARARSVPSAVLETEAEALLPKLAAAEATLVGARAHLTGRGRDFLDRLQEVAA
jgi:HEXXH motif-containing protein